MTEAAQPGADVEALRAEIARLNKVVSSLVNRAEREAGARLTHFGLFQNAVTLETQVKRRTAELEAALHENERINRDLQREIEERLRINDALAREREEQRALIRKLEEARNQLLQSEKLAAIGQLAAGVAHEINNPIGFVTSNLGTLQKYAEQLLALLDEYSDLEPLATPELRQRLDKAKDSADLPFLRQDIIGLITESIDGTNRVRRIVQDLRDFSRPGQAEWQKADLHAGLESTLNVVWNEIKYKAEVVREYGELPLIECLPFQLNQVFLNLLVNAAQAIAERGRITLRSSRDGNYVAIAISDTGCGIPTESIDRIFDPFFTTKPIGKGTGLGLSVAYGIVAKHGGRIDVESALGVGSTFTIRLPIKRPDSPTASPSHTVPNDAATCSQS